MSDSSDDSDICENYKNVQSVLVKSRLVEDESHEYVYKRRLGDLIFDANFETGNLGYVENVDRYEYDLMVRPDVYDTNNRIWFNFRISNQRLNQCAILTFVNISENLRMFHEGYCPVIRTRKRPNWINLNEEQVFYYRSQNHGNRYILSIVLRFSSQDDEHQLALFYPYSCSTLYSFLDRWMVEIKRREIREDMTGNEQACPNARQRALISRKSPEPTRQRHHLHEDQLRTRSSLDTRSTGTSRGPKLKFKLEEVARSLLYKPIYCVRIGADQVAMSPKLISKVLITCRAKSGNLDAICSYVCQGLMDYLLSDSLIARAARECIDFIVLPMLDPDSIYCGNSCTGLLGRKSQESATPSEMGMAFESNLEQKLSDILDGSNDYRRTIVLELQTDMDLIGSRIVGSHFVDALRMEKHLSVPKAMVKFIGGFYLEACSFSRTTNADRAHSSPVERFFASTGSIVVDHYRFDLSPCGSFKPSLGAREYMKYDLVSYLLIGKGIVYSLVDLLGPKNNDHISYLLDKYQHHQPHSAEGLILNVERYYHIGEDFPCLCATGGDLRNTSSAKNGVDSPARSIIAQSWFQGAKAAYVWQDRELVTAPLGSRTDLRSVSS